MYVANEHFSVLPPNGIPSFTTETILEKGSGALCEDVLLADGDIFGVFDGATSLGKNHFKNGMTGGLLAAELAASAFRKKNGNLLHLAAEANNHIRIALESNKVNVDERHLLWSASGAVVRLHGDRMEFCQTGDAHILLLFEDGTYKLVTPEIDIDRETLLMWKGLGAQNDGAIHQILAEKIKAVRLEMNRSYGVFNGEEEAMDFVNHGYEDMSGVTDVLLFTDGLFFPKENPELSNDWDYFAEMYRRDGLQAMRDYVRRLQMTDAELVRYPRFKVHDDIAAVAIKIKSDN